MLSYDYFMGAACPTRMEGCYLPCLEEKSFQTLLRRICEKPSLIRIVINREFLHQIIYVRPYNKCILKREKRCEVLFSSLVDEYTH